MKAFAARFDPQPFHVDEAAAQQSHFGALCASGWHTAAVWMRLMVDHRRRMIEAVQARGEPVARIGPALGVRDLKWLKPVYVGDTIDYASEVVETRVSDSRPGIRPDDHSRDRRQPERGPVISFLSTTFIERRPETTMSVSANKADPIPAAHGKAEERRALGVACGAHALHDGYTDLIYVMLPIWQGEFGLGFAALGLMKTVFSGTLAGFQIPAGFWPNVSAPPPCWRSARRLPASAIASQASATASSCWRPRCSSAASAPACSIRWGLR